MSRRYPSTTEEELRYINKVMAPPPKTAPKGMRELKPVEMNGRTVYTDSKGRGYTKAPDGSLRRLFKK